MAISRGMIVFCFMTLMVCSFLVKVSYAEGSGGGCNPANPDDSQRCADVPEDEDDFDDTYKVVNNMKISTEMIILGH
ncbi:hypothetical protein PTKIN_Ptkin15bG0163300 [Pterospermum kingtungense]